MIIPDSQNPLSKGFGFVFAIIFGLLVADILKLYLVKFNENSLWTFLTLTPFVFLVLLFAVENYFWSSYRSDEITSSCQLVLNLIRYIIEFVSISVMYDFIRVAEHSSVDSFTILSKMSIRLSLLNCLFALWQIFYLIELIFKGNEKKRTLFVIAVYISFAVCWFLASFIAEKYSCEVWMAIIQFVGVFIFLIVYLYLWKDWYKDALNINE